MKMRIQRDETAFVAFRSRELGEQFLACTCGGDHFELKEESNLDSSTKGFLTGAPIFLFQDERMLEEIRRRGRGFPFCEFVSEYRPPVANE